MTPATAPRPDHPLSTAEIIAVGTELLTRRLRRRYPERYR